MEPKSIIQHRQQAKNNGNQSNVNNNNNNNNEDYPVNEISNIHTDNNQIILNKNLKLKDHGEKIFRISK